MKESLPNNRIIFVLFFLTVVLGVMPFLLYGWARIFGSLPSEAVWRATRGGNHGPWWCYQPHDLLITFSLLSLAYLPLLTLSVSVVTSVLNRRGVLALYGVGLSVLQWAFAWLILVTVFWTID